MNRLSGFIVNKRILLLVIFIALAVVGGIAMNFVNINYDMTSYLPNDSANKKGIEVMADEFGESSYINLMFKNLTDDEKSEILDELTDLPYVDSVVYDADSEDYNKDENTLFVVNLSVDSFSEESTEALHAIQDKYADYDAYTTGPVKDNQYIGVDPSVLVIALILLLVILFIMCKSWIEPVLFVIAIGVAVLLNEGTNIFFPNISSMTKSIAALLQMVLSMDYSIMLIDRYRQEKPITPDKETAMKNAISKGFLAIAGSSVTTIVGLLCLVFMSFTIGLDLGLVLAKGVFFSLICILFMFPGLVLLFDNLIEKTQKKSLSVNMDKIAVFVHKVRFVILPLFLVLFIVGFFVKDYILIEYNISSRDPDKPITEAIFTPDNTLVVLYDNEDEANVSALIPLIEADSGVKSVSAYSNTLGEKYTADDLADNMDIDVSLIQMLFYEYDDGEIGKMTMRDFIDFILNDIAENEQFKEYFDDEILSQLKQFNDLDKEYSSGEIAEIFNTDEESITQLFMYYYIQNGGVEIEPMTLPEFVSFIKANTEDSSQIDMLAAYTDVNLINKKCSSIELAGLFNMDSAAIDQLFYMYFSTLPSIPPENRLMSPYEFASFMLSVSDDPQLSSLKSIMEASLSGKKFSVPEMSALTGTDEAQTTQLYLYHQSLYGNTDDWKLSIKTVVDFINDEAGELIEAEMLDQVKSAKIIIDAAASGTSYSSDELSGMISGIAEDIDTETIGLLYLYYFSGENSDSSQMIALYDFIKFMIDDILPDERFASYFDDDIKTQLDDARSEIESGKSALVSDNYSRMIITSAYGEETEEVYVFIEKLQENLNGATGDYYIVGNSSVNYEMQNSFQRELNNITILTIISVFIVVAAAFKSLTVPTVLVLLIQCAVYLTTAVAYIQGSGTYYLALIIVQAILMGATIDYAILYTEYYRKLRESETVVNSMINAYRGSITTILTSSSILCLVTLIIGFVAADPTTAQVCLTISKGTFFAVMLVLFVLPALLAIFDKFVSGKKRLK